MICFRDKTYCSSDCVNTRCSRNFSPSEKEASERWWKGLKGYPPIAMSDFSNGCEDYVCPK